MKSGIDYFPLDVALDEKFELIEAEFGLTGFGVVVKLLQKIYGGQGYYAEWTKEVALLFAKKVGVGGNAVSEIVTASIERGIFDKTLYDKYHILTSKGIQKRYFEAVGRRKSVEIERAYLLVNVTDFIKNVNILSKNANIFSKNADISRQSKVEESRVKESKVNGGNARTREGTPLERFLERWQVNSNAIGNYSGGKLAGIDWDRVSEKTEQSADILQKHKDIGFFIRNYEEILDGKFDDLAYRKRGSRVTDDALEARRREYDEMKMKRRGNGSADET